MRSDDDLNIYVYMLCCADNSFYTGWTNCLEKRLAMHQSGKGSKYTRSRLPVRLIFKEQHPTRSAAMKREIAIKKMSRREKEQLLSD